VKLALGRAGGLEGRLPVEIVAGQARLEKIQARVALGEVNGLRRLPQVGDPRAAA
jgi:hypothetical protein